jgi:hypothetical protein
MTLHLASETPPVDVAWEAFDTAALELQRMYKEGSYLSRTRREQSLKVAKLWSDFIALMGDADQPRPAA